MTSPAPGWYPDPATPEQLRWWDGQQWGEHFAPAQAEVARLVPQQVPQQAPTETPTPPQKRSRGKLWLILGASAAAVALVATVAITALGGAFGSADSELVTETVAAPGQEYAYTAPMLEVEPSSPLKFAVDFDWDARVAEAGGAEDWAFELYLDPGLTRFERAWVYQSKGGAPLEIRPFEQDTVHSTGSESARVMSEGRSVDGWGLQPEYYLVRKIDALGNSLEQPVVTKITTKPEFEAPVVSAAVDPTNGTLTLSWQPVEGATDYVVVGSSSIATDTERYRHYSLFGTTHDTSWSSRDKIDRAAPGDFYPSEQNVGLELYDGESSDQLVGDNVATFSVGADGYAETEFAWGVVATDGTSYSHIAEVDASAMAGSLPLRTAWNEMTNHGMSHLMWDSTNPLTSIPRVYAFTGLDGVTRSTQARIPEGGISVGADPNTWVIRVEGVGTLLGEEIEYTFDHGATTTPEAFAASFNAEAEAMRPATGLGNFTVISGTPEEITDQIDNAATKPASAEYPAYGSDDYVQFIAGHLIAGTEYIDVTEFAAAPGAQSFSDAFDEAFYQNPYAVGVPYAATGARYNPVSHAGERVIYRLNYTMQNAERESLQAVIAAGVDAALAESINDAMSASEKATALNNWLITHTAYDYAALDASSAGADLTPMMSAWRADGVFTGSAVVCLGYAEAYSALMNAAGVPTVVVTGEVLDAGGHAWNKVNIDGRWLAVDPTWNDTEASNQYLLISDAGFTDAAARTEDHQWVRNDRVSEYATP